MKSNEENLQKKWLTNFNQSEKNKTRLFAFPYSGSGAIAYHSWAPYFSQYEIDLIGIQLPGRENRRNEKLITNLTELTDLLFEIISPMANIPFAFLGHSMGGLIAFELTQKLQNSKLPLPQHLFISGLRTPDMPNPNPELHQLSDSKLLKKIAEYGGTPSAILNNIELMALLLPIIRADFELFETYRYKASEPLRCPITLFSGSEDNIVRPAYLKNWETHTTKVLNQAIYSGNHFFIQENKHGIIDKIAKTLKNN